VRLPLADRLVSCPSGDLRGLALRPRHEPVKRLKALPRCLAPFAQGRGSSRGRSAEPSKTAHCASLSAPSRPLLARVEQRPRAQRPVALSASANPLPSDACAPSSGAETSVSAPPRGRARVGRCSTDASSASFNPARASSSSRSPREPPETPVLSVPPNRRWTYSARSLHNPEPHAPGSPDRSPPRPHAPREAAHRHPSARGLSSRLWTTPPSTRSVPWSEPTCSGFESRPSSGSAPPRISAYEVHLRPVLPSMA
jgi:hypothetical protein